MRPETRAAYPRDWAEIARRTREERGNRCQGCGQEGDRVSDTRYGNNYLTVHHRDGNPANCHRDNLLLLCQACHLRLQQGRPPRLLQIEAGQLPLFELKEERSGHGQG